MAKKEEFVFLRLAGDASVFVDRGLGIKLVRDVPQKVDKRKFEAALKNKKSELSKRVGTHIVLIDQDEYNELVAVSEQATEESVSKKADKLKAAVAKLKKAYGSKKVDAALKADEDDEEEDEDEADDEGEAAFDSMSKNEIIDWLIKHDEDTEEDDRVELLKSKKNELVAMASEVEEVN